MRTERETLASLGCIADARWDTRELPKIDGSLSALMEICSAPRPRLGSAHVGGVATGPLLTRHAKQPDKPFAVSDRGRLHREIPQRLREDVAAVVAWSYNVCRATPRGAPLPNALAPVEKSYN